MFVHASLNKLLTIRPLAENRPLGRAAPASGYEPEAQFQHSQYCKDVSLQEKLQDRRGLRQRSASFEPSDHRARPADIWMRRVYEYTPLIQRAAEAALSFFHHSAQH